MTITGWFEWLSWQSVVYQNVVYPCLTILSSFHGNPEMNSLYQGQVYLVIVIKNVSFTINWRLQKYHDWELRSLRVLWRQLYLLAASVFSPQCALTMFLQPLNHCSWGQHGFDYQLVTVVVVLGLIITRTDMGCENIVQFFAYIVAVWTEALTKLVPLFHVICHYRADRGCDNSAFMSCLFKSWHLFGVSVAC